VVLVLVSCYLGVCVGTAENGGLARNAVGRKALLIVDQKRQLAITKVASAARLHGVL
jgi:hypothetical protein